MMSSSHSWLLIVTVALCATVISGGKSAIPFTDDPLFNKILSTTEESKPNVPKKWSPDPKVPLADDPRFNKMLPLEHFDRIEKEAVEQLNAQAKLANKVQKPVKKVVEIKQNAIDKTTKSTADDEDEDDYEYDYNYDDYKDEIVTSEPVPVSKKSTTSKPQETTTTTTSAPIVAKKSAAIVKDPKIKLVSEADDLEDDDDDSDSDEDDDEDDDSEDDDPITSSEPIVCPRDCACNRNMNGFMVATCTRLDAGIQNFSSGITDLEVVNVSQKYPIVLGARFFKLVGLQDVSSIKIVNSFIDNIHPRAFEGLNELYSVNLTNSGITVLHPDTFAENRKLHLLSLDANDLSQMQQSSAPFNSYMLKAPSVEELSLSRCNLKKLLPTAFNRLDSITFINLAYNDLQTLPANLFDKVINIEELDLSYNKISSLPRDIFNRTALAVLNLKYNQIESDLDFATSEIQKLDLSFNNITTIYSSMFNDLTGLETLILKGNGIRKIHQTAFFPLKSLRQIDLSYNELEQLSATLFLVNKELDVIRLNDNLKLKSLPLEGFACENGKFNVYLFDLQNCDISELGDDTFKNMPRMTTLNLASNNIETLSKEFFKGMTKLIELNLSNNIISELDDLTFLYNRNLKKLNLSGNRLTKISPRMFLLLKDLTELDLSNCDLEEIWSESITANPPTSTVLKNLKLLNVSNNNIVHPRHSHFSSMEKLEVLDLSRNNMHCDEGFRNLMQWLKDRKIKAGNVHAGFNAELTEDGQAVDTISSYDLGWEAFAKEECSKSRPAPEVKIVEKVGKTETGMVEGVDEIDDIEEDVDDSTRSNKETNADLDGDDSDSEYSDSDEDDDDFDDEIEINGANNVEIEDEEAIRVLAMAYRAAPYLLIAMSALLLVGVTALCVSRFMHRRGERYRQSLLAAKNSIIYQKLSEDIYAPQTPKFHRYAPINQV